MNLSGTTDVGVLDDQVVKSITLIRQAVDRGVTFFDTAEVCVHRSAE